MELYRDDNHDDLVKLGRDSQAMWLFSNRRIKYFYLPRESPDLFLLHRADSR